MNMDGLFPHIQKNQLESLPIPIMPVNDEKTIIALVKSHLQKPSPSTLEEINRVVYSFYGLSPDEITVIEQS